MRLRSKFILTTLVIGVFAFAFNPAAPAGAMIWPEMPGEEEPTGIQIGLLMFYTLLSSLAMGFSIAFWAFAMPWTRRAFPIMTGAVHFAIGFIGGSFWLHDSLHMVNGENMNGLIALEYTFHLPAILCGLLLAIATIRGVQARMDRPGYAATA